jgi:alkylation response protein AidB-like acyl-CoA dehydrogenase
MTTYAAPVKDMSFVMNELAGLNEIAKLPGCEEMTPDVVQTILDEAGRFAAEVLAPINQSGDRVGSQAENGVVTTPPGFKEAYRKFIDGGWPTVACPPKFGGQGLPHLVSMALHEMWDAANMSFSLCPMLTQGAVEALENHASEELKARYLPPMVKGEWTGTMNLTEAQAGSDLAAVRTRAIPEGDHYRIVGTKIFITYGEHDLTSNIVHTVLARLPDAPEGVKGISLFLVPKYLANPDGSLGARNDLQCVSVEHKLGIHASPTAIISYGEKGGAIGYMIGQPNRGLEYMFTMMNRARIAVGFEGIGISERAYQRALAYARERVQGKPLGHTGAGRAPIIQHPDVRRMLLSMKAQTEAMRALGYVAVASLDTAMRHPDAKERARHQAAIDFYVPIVKGWSTEQGIEVASTGIQVHGGMGFIEETGAAQHLRDARITTIYEGTTGIQAMDLVGRKVARDAGATAMMVIAEMHQTRAQLTAARSDELAAIGASLEAGIGAVDDATRYVLDHFGGNPRAAAAGSVPYLMLLGTVLGGWQMARAALVAQKKLPSANDKSFYETKIATARFYADHILPRASAYRHEVVHGADSTLRLDDAQF